MRPWGCTSCGSTGPSKVLETGYDSEGYVVRRRRCEACGQDWETEERPLAPGVYWSRAENRRKARAARYLGHARTCHKCGAAYLSGYWRKHIRRSKQHAAALRPIGNGMTSRERVRQISRESKRRRRDPELGSAGRAA